MPRSLNSPFTMTLCLFVFLFSGCKEKLDAVHQHQDIHTHSTEHASSTSRNIPATSQDQTDIQELDQFNADFNTTTQEIYQELQQLKRQNMLRPDYLMQRKYDQARAAVNMLDDLELNTAQGKQIKDLLTKYWEQQALFLKSKTQVMPISPQPADINDLIEAEKQLMKWKTS